MSSWQVFGVAGVRRHAAAVFLALCALAAGAAPVAVCSAPTHDFGVRTDDGVVKHLFRIENKGDRPLVLQAGRACCGAKLTLPERPVPPGQGVDLPVELALRGRDGKINKALYIHTNDPALAVLKLELTGRVIAIPGPPAF